MHTISDAARPGRLQPDELSAAAGFDAHLVKPVALSVLNELLASRPVPS